MSVSKQKGMTRMMSKKNGVLVAAVFIFGALFCLGGQRGSGTNVYVGEVLIIVNDDIVATTLQFDSNLKSVNFYAKEIKERNWDIKANLSVTFSLKTDPDRKDQIAFKGYNTLKLDTRGKGKHKVDDGGMLHGIPTVICTYKHKDGSTHEIYMLLRPTRLTR